MPRIMSTAARPSSTKSSGCGSSRRWTALSLEDRQQLVQRPPELRLAARRRLRSAVELRVHHPAVQVDGELDRPLPVADRRLPLVLVRPGPAVERQVRGDPHPGPVQRGPEPAHHVPVGPRVQEERGEVLARRQLDPLVAEVGDQRRAVRSAAYARSMYGSSASFMSGSSLRRRARVARPATPAPGSRSAVPRAPRPTPPPRRSRPSCSGRARRPRRPRRSTPAARRRTRGRTALASRRVPGREASPPSRTRTGLGSPSAAVPSSPTTSPRMS